jgi:hypothetical protein
MTRPKILVDISQGATTVVSKIWRSLWLNLLRGLPEVRKLPFSEIGLKKDGSTFSDVQPNGPKHL